MKYTFKFSPTGSTSTVTAILCPGGKEPALAGLKAAHAGQMDLIEPVRAVSGVPIPRGVGTSTESFRACKEFATIILAEQYARIGLAQMRGTRGVLTKETTGGKMSLVNAVCISADVEVIGILTITQFTFTGSLWTF
jgi:hypothetical protein